MYELPWSQSSGNKHRTTLANGADFFCCLYICGERLLRTLVLQYSLLRRTMFCGTSQQGIVFANDSQQSTTRLRCDVGYHNPICSCRLHVFLQNELSRECYSSKDSKCSRLFARGTPVGYTLQYISSTWIALAEPANHNLLEIARFFVGFFRFSNEKIRRAEEIGPTFCTSRAVTPSTVLKGRCQPRGWCKRWLWIRPKRLDDALRCVTHLYSKYVSSAVFNNTPNTILKGWIRLAQKAL